ncbi:hypothetical protein LTR17_023501 [Elasticomyces elasticus]|nr:hypothetical protein LTR17_023501 [Elasticomyces elasticus]
MASTSTKATATDTPDQVQQAVTVTVQEAYNKYNDKFLVACSHESSMVGAIGGTLREFLEEVKGVPYYEMKANIALSAANEENEEWENHMACRHFLDEAAKMLVVCQATYTLDEDVKAVKAFEKIIEEERAELREREKAADSDFDSD